MGDRLLLALPLLGVVEVVDERVLERVERFVLGEEAVGYLSGPALEDPEELRLLRGREPHWPARSDRLENLADVAVDTDVVELLEECVAGGPCQGDVVAPQADGHSVEPFGHGSEAT
jgi:hypothetical protein